MLLPAADPEGHADGEAESVHVAVAPLAGEYPDVVNPRAQADVAAAERVDAASELKRKVILTCAGDPDSRLEVGQGLRYR